MKNQIKFLCLALVLSSGVASAADKMPQEKLTLGYEKIEWDTLQEEAKKARKSKAFKEIAPKRLNKTQTDKRTIGLIKKFRKLNRKIVKTTGGSNKLVAGYAAQYSEIESQTDSLANAGGNAEGKGACMKECGDSFPGTGGGNGANRIACKLSCLILGE